MKLQVMLLLAGVAVLAGAIAFLSSMNGVGKPETAAIVDAPLANASGEGAGNEPAANESAANDGAPVASDASDIAMPEEAAPESAPASVAPGDPAATGSPVPERTQNLQSGASLFEDLLNVPENLEDSTITQRSHKTFADEPVDPTLSSNVEPQVQEVMNKAPGAESYEIVSMACRESTCEILAASRTPELAAQANDQFQTMVVGMTREPWWSTYGFTDSSYHVWSAPDGRTVMAAYMSKKQLPR